MTMVMDGRIELLDHGYLQLVEKWGSEEQIVESARMSTGKGFLGWGVEETCEGCDGSGTGTKMLGHGPGSLCPKCRGRKVFINKPGDEKLLRTLWTNEHGTPFEMAGITIEVQAPIMVFREWHRHRVPFGYNELSARYTPLPDFDYVPSIERVVEGAKNAGRNKQAQAVEAAPTIGEVSTREWLDELTQAYQHCERVYQSGLKRGVPKELARLIVPVGRYSRMRATGNLRGWLAFLKLRDAKPAQHEIRVFAKAVHVLLTGLFPRTLALFDEGRS